MNDTRRRLPALEADSLSLFQAVYSSSYSLDNSLSDLILPWGCCSCFRDFQAASFLLFW